MTYPLHLELSGRRVLVVGGGAVATRRVVDLVEAGADVFVVAPQVTEAIRALPVEVAIRQYQSSDIDGVWLVHAATDVAAINEQVAADAQSSRIWCVRADDANVSAARRPAVGDVDDVTFSVASGDPRRSVLLRDAVTGLLRAGEVGARRQRERATGSVVLIGGGPGAADLITVRGRKALLDADVVVFDRLAPLELLKDLDAGVELIDASKSPDNHVLTQDQINAVIVERARGGLRVARLKGGDPYVLGRGSEEVFACIEAGVAVEVIPGITSAIAGPSAAGIPVTHRGITAGFTVVSGHEIGDLEHVIKSRLTLVVLMGVKTLPQLVSEFFKHGASPSTPVAIVEKAFAPEQRTLRTTLAEVVADAQRMHISNPAIVVVGDVAALGADLKV